MLEVNFRVISIVSICIFVMTGCSTKITSIMSPLNNLEKKQCFILPSKSYLSAQTINTQMLYTLTSKSLSENSIKTYYGVTNKCKNYLQTSWTVTTGSKLVTTGGDTYSTTNANMYNSYYNVLPSYIANTSTYTTAKKTYNVKTYYGKYITSVGKIKNKKFIKIWEGNVGGALGAKTLEEAEKVSEKSKTLIDSMITQMLTELKWIKHK